MVLECIIMLITNMRKSIIIIFFSVLILTTFLVAVYFLSGRKNKTTAYQIYPDATNITLYPYMAWEDITSGKLLDFLKNEDSKGKLLQLPASAEPISLTSTDQEFFNTKGISYVQLPTNDVLSNKYKNLDLLPFRFIAFFKTELGGTAYFVLVEKWLNADGSTAFLPLIIPESLALKDNTISSYYDALISNNSRYFLSPILQIKNQTECKSILLKRESYCDWYFQDPKIGNTLLGIMNEWTQTGNLPSSAGMMPLVVTATRLVND